MYFSFPVIFRDEEELLIEDVNDFGVKQREEVRNIASEWTKKHLRAQKYGYELETIESHHKSNVLKFKDNLTKSRESADLYNDRIIKVSLHSVERTFQRIGTIGKDEYIGIINKVKNADKVIKTQWKGYPHLTYTLLGNEKNEELIIAFHFIFNRKGNDTIKIITVVPNEKDKEAESMENRLIEDPKLAKAFAKMEELFNED